jgi:hypothetical protein
MGRACSTHEKRNAYEILVGKLERKRPVRRPGCRWEDNIKMDLREIVCGSIDWIHLPQDRDQLWAVLSTITNLRVP